MNEFPSVTVLFRGSLGSRDGNSEVKKRNNGLAVRYDYSFSVLQMGYLVPRSPSVLHLGVGDLGTRLTDGAMTERYNTKDNRQLKERHF